MKCPDDGSELAVKTHHGVAVEQCPSCRGMWLGPEELDALEDEGFDLGDREKGTLVFAAEPSTRACPECNATLMGFQYRLYDLPLEFCPAGHGYWLDAGEDDRVLKLMRGEEKRLKHAEKAETRWAAHLRRLRAPGFFEKLRGLME